MKKIVVTIPAYNEEKTIGNVIDEIKSVMNGMSYKILVVDDGSSDKTSEIAASKGAVVFKHKSNRGLAATFKTEIEQCLKMKADIIVHTDADGQYPAQYIPELIKEIENGNDLVIGSRFKKGINYKNEFTKLIGNIIFSKAISRLIKKKITDSTSGFRAFTRVAAEEIKFINTFTYTQEQIIKAAKLGFSISEVHIETRKTRKSRLFSSSLSYATKSWINIFRIYRDFNPLAFFGKIGLFLFLTGCTIGIYLVFLFLTTGKIGHLPLAIFSIALIIVGIQIITFGFLADMRKI